MKHTPRKRFSQNFLIDPQIIAEIIHAIRPSSGERLIEIGPGLGALTRPLLQIADHLHAIEIDRDSVKHLRLEFPEEKLTIHSAEALKFDFLRLG